MNDQHKTAISVEGSPTGYLTVLIGAMSLIVAALFLIPFRPLMPNSGLDPSWRYALNEALAHGYVFGRDLIFTFGPLGSVYSTVYDPATDKIMMIGSTVYSIGLCVAVGLVAHPRRHLVALAFPFIICLSLSRDSGFLALPFFLLLAVTRASLPKGTAFRLEPTPLVVLGIGISTIATAMSPIVKGSFVGSTFSICGLALVALASKNMRAAAAFAALIGVALFSAWGLTGQPLAQLPHFLLGQGPIISGYTDAMSLGGPLGAPALYLLVALLLLIAFYSSFVRRTGRLGWGTLLGLGLILFIAFKAGFVRQDGHVFVATGTLLLLAYAISLVTKPRVALLLWFAAAYAWTLIGGTIFPINTSYIASRIDTVWNDTVSGITTRLTEPNTLKTEFAAANKKIRDEFPLPHVAGNVDIYPTELSAVFANGLSWAGRPVFQSYSVYDPRLDAKNVAHLRSVDAPQTVFFTFAPIDRRLPTFDDSGSLLTLLSDYRVVGYSPPYVRLEKTFQSSMAVLAEEQARVERGELGQTIALNALAPTWLTLNVRPTLIGKIVGILFKLPELQIELTLDNGQVVQHRFIPAIGRTGFIVSPYMTSSQDYMLVAAGLPGTPRVKSFKITSDHKGLWKTTFDMRTIPIKIIPQLSAKSLISTAPSTPPADLLMPAQAPKPTCHIDFVNGEPLSAAITLTAEHDTLRLDGWIAPGETIASGSFETWIVLKAEDGSKKYFKAKSTARPDVAAALSRPDLQNAGFSAVLDLASVSGEQTIELLSRVDSTVHSCGIAMNME
ncbi:MAG TPA: hypothetical protein VNO24_17415 [Blastocatellia bacterium]|nr:hypothetical protein [Blastocatellia bacterium]